jgi:cytochrome c peroxidase
VPSPRQPRLDVVTPPSKPEGRSCRLLCFLALALFARIALADPSLGLPHLSAPPDRTAARIELGRKLFMDRRLSPNGTMSCGMCHIPEQGFAANEMATAIGMQGRSLRRNAPTLLNVVFQRTLFHDGRSDTLENQVWGPLLAPDEMSNLTRSAVVARVSTLPDYSAPFERAFPQQGATERTIAAALASYERALIAADSRFDRWFLGGEASALISSERAGFELFTGKAGCSACHTVGADFALFTDHGFHNSGVGWLHANTEDRRVSVPLGGGETTEVSVADMTALFGGGLHDDGRFEVTHEPSDRWAYKTPSLRNVALTAPYMHDGSLATLSDVIDFYDRGGIDNPGKDPLLRPLHLTALEKQQLAAFLLTLTSDEAGRLAAEARAAFHSRKPD